MQTSQDSSGDGMEQFINNDGGQDETSEVIMEQFGNNDGDHDVTDTVDVGIVDETSEVIIEQFGYNDEDSDHHDGQEVADTSDIDVGITAKKRRVDIDSTKVRKQRSIFIHIIVIICYEKTRV